jgi:hypothetical protein
MQELQPPDTFFLSAAIGWLQLGDVGEAKAELGNLSEGAHNHPDVLEVRWLICAQEQQWAEGLLIARELLKGAPNRSSGWLHHAYALRRVAEGSVKMAWEALLPAFDKFPGEPTIAYNLSCYACQMQQLDAARVWFKRACVIGNEKEMKKMALADPDLQTLWEEIRAGF